MNTRILLIGQGLFLDGLTHILIEQPEIEIVAAVNSLEEAYEIIDKQSPNIVILDHDEANLRQPDLAHLLESKTTSLKVIVLTLSNNKMIVHNWQQLSDVSVPDLINALQLPKNERID